MPLTEIKPSHYNLIVDRISEGRCVPFLGAGVNASSKDYKGLPLAYEVALHLVRGLTKNFTKEQLKDLANKAEEDVELRMVQLVSKLDDEQIRQLPRSDIEGYLRKAEPLPASNSDASTRLSATPSTCNLQNFLISPTCISVL